MATVCSGIGRPPPTVLDMDHPLFPGNTVHRNRITGRFRSRTNLLRQQRIVDVFKQEQV
jgi:hypothetical protein